MQEVQVSKIRRLLRIPRLCTNWPVIFTEDLHTTNQKPAHLQWTLQPDKSPRMPQSRQCSSRDQVLMTIHSSTTTSTSNYNNLTGVKCQYALLVRCENKNKKMGHRKEMARPLHRASSRPTGETEKWESACYLLGYRFVTIHRRIR